MTELLVDTSVAIPYVVSFHPAHSKAKAAVGGRSVALAGHALHETYAVLTRFPGVLRFSPADAIRLVEKNFERTRLLDAKSTRGAPAIFAGLGISGGATYDGLVALAARNSGLPLASRDRRAQSTYRLLGVKVETID